MTLREIKFLSMVSIIRLLIELDKEITGSLHGFNLKGLDSFFSFRIDEKRLLIYTFWFVPNVFNEGAFFLLHRRLWLKVSLLIKETHE